MASKSSSNQDKKKFPYLNPTGKGGFGDRPEDINREGSWSPRDSQTYLLRKFSKMTERELLDWNKNTTPETRTAAEVWAYTRALKAKSSLNDYRTIIDRMEGTSVSRTELSGVDGKAIEVETKLSPEQQEIINKGVMDIYLKLHSDEPTEIS